MNVKKEKKRKPEEEPENHERWLISYADFLTLLFAFFVAMYSVSQVDQKKLGKFSQSIRTAFNVFPLSVPGQVTAIFGETKPILIPPINPLQLSQSTLRKLEKEKFKKMQSDLTKGFNNKEKGVTVSVGSKGLEIRLGESLLFNSGEATIQAHAYPVLDALARSLVGLENNIRVEGHTDNVPISTSQFPSNWELSAARASSVVKYFISHHNVSPLRFSASGYGEHRPLASNDTAEGRAANRRVEIVAPYTELPQQEIPDLSSSTTQ
ncbi:MAG: OmpA family protein [Candidatus Tectomicrobia bacterium]|uniref:OmpA family protein n=1 Tax=Tectimicrobiota bacterium TaxID=2528274 RepID=A0A933GLF4_UNCTE|nr:OmpA family protein [Candidatus Tectomicrobia bacterium]